MPRGSLTSQTVIPMLTTRGQADEHPALPTRGGGQKTEGGADIVHAGDVENRQDPREFKLQVMAGDVRLAELVGQNHEGRQQQPRCSPAAILFNAHAN